MNGKRSIIVLGAGASYCSGIPMQENLIENLFMSLDTTDGEGFPSFSMTHGLIHSFPLGQYLRKLFNIPEDKNKRNSKLDFWPYIQKRGYNLEGLYGYLETIVNKEHSFLIDDFEAIIRTAVSTPTGDRSINSVCNYHRNLVENLEPGDCIINFNWDSVMADALLYYSYLWFPATGFALPDIYSMSKFQQKQFGIQSYIHLYHVHGSVFLYKLIDKPEGFRGPEYLYVGPKSYNVAGSMQHMIKSRGESKDMTDEETRRFHLGYLYFNKCWFKPVFLPPSKHKAEYKSSYVLSILENVHHQLISADQIIIIGYSAPDSDIEHLQKFFIPQIISPNVKIKVINRENDKHEYRDKFHAIFPNIKVIDFSDMDFKEWSMSLSNN